MLNKSQSITITFRVISILFLVAGFIYLSVNVVRSAETDGGQIKRGAQLYDKWYKLTGAEVDNTHPLYPSAGKKSGQNTWRCKECHGWDYIGKDGRYSKGSHYTGIEGLFPARNKTTDVLYNTLSGDSHAFAGKLSEADIRSLVAFIKKGQIDTTEAINAEGKGTGAVKNGANQYAANCADCHGNDGNDLDFNDKKDGIQGIGWLANDNPQETLHKIRWGHPGSDMPSLIIDKGLSNLDAVDILTYSQTLK